MMNELLTKFVYPFGFSVLRLFVKEVGYNLATMVGNSAIHSATVQTNVQRWNTQHQHNNN